MLPIFHQQLLQKRREVRMLRLNRRLLRHEANPFDLPNKHFIQLYRLNKDLVRRLIIILAPHLRAPLLTGSVSIETKVFCTLRFYATGSYQRCVGEETNCSLSQTGVHRAIHEVTNAINESMAADCINFPSTLEERIYIKVQFMNMWNFPGVIGAIDCSHIAIIKPQDDEHNFINRKGFHSINCQVICDHNLKIRNIFANYGGSTHDSFIWRNSRVKDFMQQLHDVGERSWLLGDSGYPLQPFLMTPFQNPPEGSPEARYNHAHIRGRNCVERCIGLWKMRFRCLLKERTLRYAPDFVVRLTKVCAILHNLCIDERLPVIPDEIVENPYEEFEIPPPVNQPQQLAHEGLQARNLIVQQYFQ